MLENIVLVVLTVGCGCWFLLAASVFFNTRTIPRINSLNAPQPEAWPKLAVIVPACNEEATIEATMRLRLKETYPNVQFVIVDDRSTDATGVISDHIAGEDPRFSVVHNTSLPEGWLGKVHALQQGLDASDSEWVLFTDADVHIAPGVLERVIAWCEHRNLDQLTLLPRLQADRLGVKMLNAFFIRVAMGSPAAFYMIESPRTRMAAGAGVFNLFRRSALARTPGMERLRLEVIDDTGLAVMLKTYGARCSIVNGSTDVHLHWYPTVNAMIHGFEKNGFAIAAYRLPLTLLMCAFLIVSEWLPFFALLQTNHPFIQMMGGLAIMAAIVATATASRALNSPAAPAVFYPVAALMMSYILFRAGILAVWRKGIFWRDTFYPLKTLREFDRILIRNVKNRRDIH